MTFTGSTGSVTSGGPAISIMPTSTTPLGVGYGTTSSLSISGFGTVVNSGASYVGYAGGGSATATVNGAIWNTSSLFVSNGSNAGTLTITGGGMVSATGVVNTNLNSGVINFGGACNVLNAGSLWARPSQLTGTGTMNTAGLYSDVNFLYDGTVGHTANQTSPSSPTATSL